MRRIEPHGGSTDDPVAVYTFQVDEALSVNVTTGSKIEIRTGTGGADCSWHFKMKESYLVEADASQGNLWTSLCTWTGPIADRQEILRPLRSMRAGQTPDALFAIVRKFDPTKRGDIQAAPQLKVTVTAGAAMKFTQTTDATGVAVFPILTSGHYELTVAPPFGWEIDNASYDTKDHDKVDIPVGSAGAVGSCRAYLLLRPTGKIHGRVLGAPALPKGADVSLLTMRSGRPEEVWIDILENSTFAFDALPPGKYALRVRNPRGRTLNSQPATIDVDTGSKEVVVRVKE